MLREARYNDIDEIINIHLAALKDGLLSKLGRTFLKKVFYPICLQSNDVLILVYEQQNKIISFVIYTKNSEQLTKNLLSKKFAIGIAILKNSFLKKSLLKDIAIVLKGFHVQIDHDYKNLLKNNPAELYLIGTQPRSQGKGIGSILVSEGLIKFAIKLNVSTCFVKTSSFKAKQFYLANQFKIVGTEYRGKSCYEILYKNILCT
jgi:hypothetical protein